MYNRYVPQQDGSYCRKFVSDPPNKQPCKESPCIPSAPQPSCPPPAPTSCKEQSGLGIGSFFRQLIPNGFDTEDLLIVLLLLLMAGDCKENQSSALLTLALYLFL